MILMINFVMTKTLEETLILIKILTFHRQEAIQYNQSSIADFLLFFFLSIINMGL